MVVDVEQIGAATSGGWQGLLPQGLIGDILSWTFIFIVIMIGAGFIFGFFYLIYLYRNVYNLRVVIFEVGSSGAPIITYDRGSIGTRYREMKLWRGFLSKKVSIPMPKREYLVQGAGGKWHVFLMRFGARDYTYIKPNISEEGVDLQATDAVAAQWNVLERRRQLQRFQTQKWWQSPFANMALMGGIFLIALLLILSKMENVANLCSAVAPSCNKAAEAFAVCTQQAGGFFQG